MKLQALTRTTACLLVLALLASCAKKEEFGAEPAPAVEASPAAPPSAPPAAADDQALTTTTAAQQMGSSAATYTDSERKFIRTANARFEVKDVYAAALGIEDTVASHGGFVVQNDISTEGMREEEHPIGDGKLLQLKEYRVVAKLTVRVPSEKTQEFLRAIVGHIVFLDSRNFAARDAQFDLLRRQLDMQRSQETQGELGEAVKEGGKLSQKAEAIGARDGAKAARDMAMIEKKEFEDQVAFSTIQLGLYQPSKVVKSERVDMDSVYQKARPGFFTRLGQDLRSGWDGLLEFVLGLASIWPVLLIGGLLAAILRRALRRRKLDKLKSE
jgi:hypothetical protein